MSSGSTPNYLLSYPLSTDPVNVARDIKSLADNVDAFLTAPAFINNLAVDGGSLVTDSVTANLFNTNATTLNIGGSATVLRLGSNGGSVYYAGDILPDTDNTGVVGNASFTWSNGQFNNLTVDGILSVRAGIDLADLDVLQFGTSDDVKMFYDGTLNIFDIELESAAVSLNITDNGTDRVVITKSTGDISTTGSVTATGFSGSGALITSLNAGNISSGTLPVARGGTGVTTSTGTGNVVLSASPTFTGTVVIPTLSLTTADTATAATHYMVETATDGVVRPKTLANTRIEIVTTAAVNSAAATTVGTITSGTWNATDISLAAGGTNASLSAVNGGVVYSTTTAMAITSAGVLGQVLTSNGASAPTWEDASGGGGTIGLESVLMFAGM